MGVKRDLGEARLGYDDELVELDAGLNVEQGCREYLNS